MPLRRLAAWVLSGLILIAASAIALGLGCCGALLFCDFAFGHFDDGNPRPLYTKIVSLIAGFIVLVGLIFLSVTVMLSDRVFSLRDLRRSFLPRLRIRTLMVLIAAHALFLGLLVFADRALHTFCAAYTAAMSHESDARVYRWIQGLDSERGGIFFVSPPDPRFWPPSLLEYFRAMERYHHGLSQKYHGAARRPWLAVPPDPPRAQETGREIGCPGVHLEISPGLRGETWPVDLRTNRLE
jgi:hypothetical protein